MWFFSSKKAKAKAQQKKPIVPPALDPNSRAGKADALLMQLRQTRAEIGEETLQRMAAALQHEQVKNQMKQAIDHDEAKRERLVAELRLQMRDD